MLTSLTSAGGRGKFDMGFRVYLKDNFSGPAANLKTSMKELKGEYDMFKSNLTTARNTTLAIGAGMLYVSKSLYDAAIEGSEFLQTMQGVLAISEATTQEFTRLTHLAVSLGRNTIFTPNQVASGMRFMAMAGQTASQIQSTAKDATYLAAATLTPLGGKLGAADILTNALKAFGLQVKYSSYMSDMLTYAANSANVSLTDVGNSIRYVAATSKNLNIPIQETIGLIMSLGNAGIQSSMAGTALENMYRYLAMSISDLATKRQKGVWASIGLSRKDITTATGSFKPMVEVLGMIKEKVDKLGAVDRQNVIKEIFGVRGQRAAGTLIRNLGQTQKFINALNSPKLQGTASRKSALMMNTLHGATLRLTSAIDGLKAAWAKIAGDAFLAPLLNGLAKIVGWFTSLIQLPVVKQIALITAGLVTLGGALLVIKAAMMSIVLATGAIGKSLPAMLTAYRGGISMLQGKGFNPEPTLASGFISGTFASGPRKGQTYYRAAVKGRAIGGFVSKEVATTSRSLTLVGRWLPRIGGFLGKGLAFLTGPWGMAIMLIVSFLPSIISGIHSLFHATEENTKALTKSTEYNPKWDELYAMLKGQTLQATFDNINRNLAILVDRHEITIQQARELGKTQEGQLLLMKLGYERGINVVAPVAVPTPVPVQGDTKPRS